MDKKQLKRLQDQVSGIQNKAEKEIAKHYLNTLASFKTELSKIYEKHSDGEKLSRDIWYKNGYLKKLEKNLSSSIKQLIKNQNEIIKKAITDAYENTYYLNGYFIEMAVLMPMFAKMSKDAIAAMVFNPLDKIKWNQRSRANTVDSIRKVKEILINGIANGHSYGQMAKAVTERLNITKNKATTIVRTETARAYSDAKLQTMQVATDAGIIMKKMWMSTLDARTRSSHQHLDGQTVGVDEPFISLSGKFAQAPRKFGVPEEDIQCRCDIYTIVDGIQPTVRMAREVEGKRGNLIPYTTFPEWQRSLETR